MSERCSRGLCPAKNNLVKEEGRLWCQRHSPSAKKARLKQWEEQFNKRYEARRSAEAKAEAIHAAERAVIAAAEAFIDDRIVTRVTLREAVDALRKVRGKSSEKEG